MNMPQKAKRPGVTYGMRLRVVRGYAPGPLLVDQWQVHKGNKILGRYSGEDAEARAEAHLRELVGGRQKLTEE